MFNVTFNFDLDATDKLITPQPPPRRHNPFNRPAPPPPNNVTPFVTDKGK